MNNKILKKNISKRKSNYKTKSKKNNTKKGKIKNFLKINKKNKYFNINSITLFIKFLFGLLILGFVIFFMKIFKRNNKNIIVEGFNTFNVIDSRIVFLDNKQWTSGINSLLKNTKYTNVTGFKISGFPFIWSNKHKKYFWYYDTDFLLAQAIRTLPNSKWTKFLPFISCINNSRYSYEHANRLLKEHPKFWKGLGPIYLNTEYNEKVNRFAMETDSEHLKNIILLAQEEKMPVAIDFSFRKPSKYYEFDDILDPEDEISYNRDLYEDSTGLFDLFNLYTNVNFIFHFEPVKSTKLIENNKPKILNNIGIVKFIIDNYPNVIIDLSGNLLLQLFKTETVETTVIDKGLNFDQRKQKFKSGIDNIKGVPDLIKLLFKPIDDFLSGDRTARPGDKVEDEIDDTPKFDFSAKGLGDRIRNIKHELLGNSFIDQDGKPTGLGKDMFNKLKNLFDQKGIKPNQTLDNPFPDSDVSSEKMDIADADNKRLKLEQDLVKLNEDEDELEKITFSGLEAPKEIEKPRKKYGDEDKYATIGKKGGAHRLMADELRKGDDDIDEGNVRKYAKKMSGDEPQLLPILEFEGFKNPSVLDMVEDAGNEAITLPSSGITRERGPVTDSELNNSKVIPPIPFTRKQLGVIKKFEKYSKSGEIKKDIRKQAVSTARGAVGEDEQGRTILERPQDLYRYGFHQYLGRDGEYTPEEVRLKYFYEFGPPEYEYIEYDDIVRRRRRRLIQDGKYDDLDFDDNYHGSRMNYMDDVFAQNPDLLKKIKENPDLIKELGLPRGMKSINTDVNLKVRANENRKQAELDIELDKEKEMLAKNYKKANDPKTSQEEKDILNKERIDNIYNSLTGSLEDPPEPEISEEVFKYDKHEYIINKQWVKLIEENPDRFIIGTGQQLNFHIYEPQVVVVNRVLAELSEEAGRKVARNNLLRIIPE